MTSQNRACLECGIRIGGRLDKKYCSDFCRTSYNNRLNSDETRFMRSVNHTLRKNRRILVELNPEGKNKVNIQQLKMRGFDFDFFTSTFATKAGATYYYCYEQGYLPLEKNLVLLVVKKNL
jgi:hypothetical protein